MQTQRAKEIGLLVAVVLLTAVAVAPLLRSDPPCTQDGGLHYFRIVAMRHALGDGLLLSRWSPDLAFGYGFPFFNYRAAVSYFAGLALHVIGLPLPVALNLVYVLGIVGSAVGAYLLGRDLFGRWAGVVAAVAYVYAPYTLIDALVRGNMPESVSLALLPFILWAFRRLLLSGQTRYLLAGAGFLALLFLTHNISSLQFTPFLVLYLLVVWLARGRRDHLFDAAIAMVLGIGLAAFYWVPAVLEKNEVQLYLTRATRGNDYRYHFVPLSEVLAPPAPADSALLNPPLRLPVGLPLTTLGALGFALTLWRWHKSRITHYALRITHYEQHATIIFLALSAAAMIFMATRASLALWDNLPLLPFVQFPWRFVGRAVLPLSLLAGAVVTTPLHIPNTEYRISNTEYLPALIITALLILTALPAAYPPTGYCPTKPHPNVLDLFAYEHQTSLVGVDPLGSYFPVTVQARPTGSPLEAQYAAALTAPDDDSRPPVARFDAERLPDGAIIHRAEYKPNYARLEIETPEAVRARYLTFAFPGWRVSIDGRPVEIIPSDPEGLITFDLPAGNHTVEVDWGSTPVRAGATILSLVTLAGGALIAYSATRNYLADRIKAESREEQAAGSLASAGAPAWRSAVALAGLALVLLAFKLLVVDRTDTLFRRPGLRTDGTLPGLDVPLETRFDDGVRLLGYDLSAKTLAADGTLHLALYWSAYARPSRSYRANVTLVDADGKLWSAKEPLLRRGYANPPPSPAWDAEHYAVRGLDVEPLPGTPPGRYDLLLTVFDRKTLAPLNVLDEAGQVSGPNMILGQVTLTRPGQSVDPDDVPMQVRLTVGAGPWTLVGANLDRAEAAPGDPVLVTLFWRSREAAYVIETVVFDLSLRLALTDEQETEWMSLELPPLRFDWLTTLWQPGDLWRGQHFLRLPASLESGTYTWRLDLYPPGGPPVYEASAELGQLKIVAPERLWESPPLQITLDAELGQAVTLLGANLKPSPPVIASSGEGTLTVTLAWQGRAEMETSYRVFLHLLRPDGSLLTQSDGEPANWTRPTTGWAPGEVLLDTRTLSLPPDTPPGQYTLVAGLYDPGTKERLALLDGGTAVLITTVEVQSE